MKKSVKIVLFLVFFAIATAAAFLVFKVKKYLDEVPVITPRSPVYAEAGVTLSITDLADIEKARISGIDKHIEWHSVGSNDTSNAEVSGDGQSLFVGDYTGSFDVIIWATGVNAEHRSEKVTVEVHADD